MPLPQLRHITHARRSTVVVIAIASVLTFAGPASAQNVDDDSSAVDEYVEDVPTSEGSTPVGGNKPGKKKPLSREATSRVLTHGGKDARVLEEIATSSAFGAPQRQIEKPGRKAVGRLGADPIPEADSSGGEALAAAATAATGGSASRLIGLLIALGLISLGTLAVLVARRPRRSR